MSSDAAADKPIYEQSIVKMKAYLDSYGVDYKDCVEKSEIVQRVKNTLENPPAKPAPKPAAPAPEEGTVGKEIVSLLGPKLALKSGKFNTTALKAKVVALYFSAHWCGPCRSFTPQLRQLYSDRLKSQGVEVVFVSADQDDASFGKYFGEMPWLAVPFGERSVAENLNAKFGIRGIPALIVLDASNGKVISDDGRRDVMQYKNEVGSHWLKSVK